MSAAEDVLSQLVKQLKEGKLLPQKKELRGYDRDAAFKYTITSELNELDPARVECMKDRDLPHSRGHVTKVAFDVGVLAGTILSKITESLVAANGDDDANDRYDSLEFWVRLDFELIATSLLLGVNDDVVKGLLVFYRAGLIPTHSVHYSGTFESVLKMKAADAKRLVREAESNAKRLREEVARKHEAYIKEMELAREELRLALAETKGRLPTSHALEMCFRREGVFADQSTRLAMTLSELGKVKVPATWRALLVAQRAGKSIPWESVWPASVRSQMSGAWKLISEKCLGVGIAVGRGFPASLLYIFATPQPSFPGGKYYFAYIGGPPIGDTGPTNDEHRSRLQLLPAGLQEFYKTVHDGWTVLGGAGGPSPLKDLSFLDSSISEEDAFDDLKSPFSLETTLEIMQTGNGDVLCLDTKRSRPQRPIGIFYWHESPVESDLKLDFWNALNDRIESGSKKWCSNKSE